jgi:hypothetical protein
MIEVGCINIAQSVRTQFATVDTESRVSGETSAKRTMNARSAPVVLFRFVVDGTVNPLFATKISFGGLNRNVTDGRERSQTCFSVVGEKSGFHQLPCSQGCE